LAAAIIILDRTAGASLHFGHPNLVKIIIRDSSLLFRQQEDFTYCSPTASISRNHDNCGQISTIIEEKRARTERVERKFCSGAI
jgi:hypothetical protein